MNQNQDIFSSSSTLNNINFLSPNLNSQYNSIFINNNFYEPIFPSSLSRKKYVKKRNYNELMESYKEIQNNLYIKENEELYKVINKNFQKNIDKFKYNYKNKSINEKIILNDSNYRKNKNDKVKDIKISKKKFIFDDDEDIYDLEKNFEKEKNIEKKYRLSKSYLFDDEPGFYSDLDDTKENSFSALNFSFDYPELNLDSTLKDKLISNAIELEKTFNRFFNVKNMPNKK